MDKFTKRKHTITVSATGGQSFSFEILEDFRIVGPNVRDYCNKKVAESGRLESTFFSQPFSCREYFFPSFTYLGSWIRDVEFTDVSGQIVRIRSDQIVASTFRTENLETVYFNREPVLIKMTEDALISRRIWQLLGRKEIKEYQTYKLVQVCESEWKQE